MANKVGLVINSPLRDLPGLVLVAKALGEAGKECFLIPQNLLMQEGLSLRPDLVLFDHLRTTNGHLVRAFHESGALVGILDQEGGVMPDFAWFQRKLPADEDLRKRVSVFCTWGSHVAEQLVARGFFAQSQVTVTGSPRLDFLVEPWRTAALAMSSKLDSIPRPMVLITTRFSLTNPEFKNREFQKRGFVKNYGHDADEVARWQDIQQVALQQMTELANKLAVRFPAITFIFRPHPFENPKIYEALLDRPPNLRLIREGSIEGWILRASALVHRCCSTAIEAGLASVPAFSPRWIAMPEEIESTESVSTGCSSFEDLADGIQRATAGPFQIPHRIQEALAAVVQRWFHRNDGLSHHRVAEQIIKAMENAHPRPPRPKRIYYQANPFKQPVPLPKRIARHLIRLAGLPVTVLGKETVRDRSGNRTDWIKSSKGFSADHVQAVLDSSSESADRFAAAQARPGGWARLIAFNTVHISGNRTGPEFHSKTPPGRKI